ncbi:MAG: hypothetical protein QXT43_02955 [Candidatus Micrarchaeaceae archaeon]
MLDTVAYGSLLIDIAVAVTNFVALRQSSSRLGALQFWLSVGLSAEVIITILLLAVLLLLYHYDKLERLVLLRRRTSKYGRYRT